MNKGQKVLAGLLGVVAVELAVLDYAAMELMRNGDERRSGGHDRGGRVMGYVVAFAFVLTWFMQTTDSKEN